MSALHKIKGPVRNTWPRVKQENKLDIMKIKTWKPVELKVLATRSPAVMPVGAWVESGDDCQEHPARVALMTQEQQSQLSREREERLHRFQEDVRKRLAQQARVRKCHQLRKSCDAAQREDRMFEQSSAASQRLSQMKLLYHAEHQEAADTRRGVKPPRCAFDISNAEPEEQHPQQLSKVMKQVRRRLASCQIAPAEQVSDLPGGIWGLSPTRDRPTSQERLISESEEEIPLYDHHDCPIALQRCESKSSSGLPSRELPLCDELQANVHRNRSNSTYTTDIRMSQVLWPREDQEELKRQRRSQYHLYRRLFMDMERAQVKELHRHRKHLQRFQRIKSDKEKGRMQEEGHIWELQQRQQESAESQKSVSVETEMLQEKEMQQRERRDREATRFVEALRAQMKEKMEQEKVELPPLCFCAESFWDSHPDTCANNCVFYHNPKAYAQALQRVLLSCQPSRPAPARRAAPVPSATPP